MRFRIFLLAGISFLFSGQCLSQNLSLSFHETKLETILRAIEQQGPYHFIYLTEELDRSSPVSIEVKSQPLETVLNLCFRGQPLVYSIEGKYITIKRKEPAYEEEGTHGLRGKLLDENENPVQGVTVSLPREGRTTESDSKGEFVLFGIRADDSLIFSSVNTETKEIKAGSQTELLIRLDPKISQLGPVLVAVNTGYQEMGKQGLTGSFARLDEALINRSLSTDILSRMDGLTSGLLFSKNNNPATNPSPISIRGRSTIFSNPNPLFVLDNFPYDGDPGSINPNDVGSITVLKDAAAASIWGAFAGNGVIVISTKNGKYNQAPKVSLNTNISLAEKPNLWYSPQLGSSDFIGLQQFLFGQGFYKPSLESPYEFVPPAVLIMQKQTIGVLTAEEAAAQLQVLGRQDLRNDLNKYYWRRSFNQQYALNLSGGGPDNQYYLSAGFDKNLPSLTKNEYERFTLNVNHLFALLDHRLEISTHIAFTGSHTLNDNSGYQSYPYAKLSGAGGSHLAVNPYKQSFLDTAGQALLLDWNWRPLDELGFADNSSKLNEWRISTGLKYKIFPGLDISLLYQYNISKTDQKKFNSPLSWFTRNLINSFSEIDRLAGTVRRLVPLGGIIDLGLNDYESRNFRVQLNFTHAWNQIHELSAIAGWETRELNSQDRSWRLYGYDPVLQTSMPVDYAASWPDFIFSNIRSPIPSNIYNEQRIHRYLSWFGNIAYSFKEKWSLSTSARRDESNLFGVNANQKAIPLWSAGLGWNISRENFYRIKSISFLRLRASDGFSGNINTSVSAYTTAAPGGYPNDFNTNFQRIINPPDPELKWERIHSINIGLDFATKNNRFCGSLEWYEKKGMDLIGQTRLAPQTGVSSFTGNGAAMHGSGIELSLSSSHTLGKSKWTGILIFNYYSEKISSYKGPEEPIYSYLNADGLHPLEGRPLYSVYAYPWAGLDAEGNPLGLVNGKASKDYGAILNSNSPGNLKYKSPANPPLFGFLRNTFTYKELSISFNIAYKFGYYFRRPSLDYNKLLGFGDAIGQADYNKRWKKPGDERLTNVPALVYPANSPRNDFYTFSEILLEKADHIRLLDIQLSYEMKSLKISSWRIPSVKLYGYIKNLGILWKANHYGIDPDFVPGSTSPVFPDPKTFSLGLNVNF
jgi:TonB-linked SusC/RagA family outer membrane protein